MANTTTVRLYTAYQDLPPMVSADHKNIAIQMQRDRDLANIFRSTGTPSFPCNWRTFTAWRAAFSTISRQIPQLCLLFVLSSGRCLVITDGVITSHDSRRVAYDRIYGAGNYLLVDIPVQ